MTPKIPTHTIHRVSLKATVLGTSPLYPLCLPTAPHPAPNPKPPSTAPHPQHPPTALISSFSLCVRLISLCLPSFNTLLLLPLRPLHPLACCAGDYPEHWEEPLGVMRQLLQKGAQLPTAQHAGALSGPCPQSAAQQEAFSRPSTQAGAGAAKLPA